LFEDATSATLDTAYSTLHDKSAAEFLTILCVTTGSFGMALPNVLTYDRSFFKRLGWCRPNQMSFVELRALACLPLLATEVAELKAAEAPNLVSIGIVENFWVYSHDMEASNL
jgi:hypothetical protein